MFFLGMRGQVLKPWDAGNPSSLFDDMTALEAFTLCPYVFFLHPEKFWLGRANRDEQMSCLDDHFPY